MRTRLALPLAWIAAAVLILAHGVITTVIMNIGVWGYGFQDTYFVVSNWHYAFSIVAVCLVFATIYAILRLSLFQRRLAWAHFAASFVGYVLMFGPGWALPLTGLPKRYEDVPRIFGWINWAASAGYAFSLLGLLLFLWVLIDAGARALRGRRSTPA